MYITELSYHKSTLLSYGDIKIIKFLANNQFLTSFAKQKGLYADKKLLLPYFHLQIFKKLNV